MIIVTAIKCPKCGDVVYSRTRHDCRCCTCGAVSIDGGFDYALINLPSKDYSLDTFKVSVEATREELYEDWNTQKDEYGLIKSKKSEAIMDVKDILTKLPIFCLDDLYELEEEVKGEIAAREVGLWEVGLLKNETSNIK